MPNRFQRAILGLILLIVFAGCHESPALVCEPGQRYALVFFDKSASAKGTVTSAEDFRGAIQELAKESLVCEGDQIGAYLLFANTGDAYYKWYEVQTPAKDLSKVDEIDREPTISRWERDVNDERTAAVSLFQKLVTEADVPYKATMHTDILETLRIIHEAFENAPQEAQKRVLYLSDMHESMPGAGRRDFDTRPPTSIEQAYEWADEDSRRLRAQGIVPEGALAGVKVRVLTSTLGIGPNAKFIRSYWQRIFENFNADVRFG